MNKPLSATDLLFVVPVVMTKREKLLRLAHVIRSGSRAPLYIFNGLEYIHPSMLDGISHPGSAFALAAKDPILQDAGLKSDSVGAAKRFFELTSNELHYFSCDCGGNILPADMADRIEHVANRN